MYISEDKKLVCSTCIGLRKEQLNRNKNDESRYYDLMLKECYKVDKLYDPNNAFKFTFLGFPLKPPRMNQEKYFKALKKYLDYRKKYYECLNKRKET
jgi:hypothetical protein